MSARAVLNVVHTALAAAMGADELDAILRPVAPTERRLRRRAELAAAGVEVG